MLRGAQPAGRARCRLRTRGCWCSPLRLGEARTRPLRYRRLGLDIRASVSPSGSWKDEGGDGGQFILGDRDCLADELIGAAADEHGYWSCAGRRTGAEGWARVRQGQAPLAERGVGVGGQGGYLRQDRKSVGGGEGS